MDGCLWAKEKHFRLNREKSNCIFTTKKKKKIKKSEWLYK